MRVTKKADAFSKINLTLDITGKTETGSHTLSSLFQTLSVKDTVEISVDFEKPFSVSLKTFPENAAECGEKQNLCYRAAEEFHKTFGMRKGKVDIKLEKNIPIKAGMGGGSSDAAATVKLLFSVFGIDDKEKMLKICEKLGSDVPFFIEGGLAEVSGTGNIIKPLPEKIKGFFVLVKPKEGLFAKDVYQKFDTLPFEKTDFTENCKKNGFSPEFFKNGLSPSALTLSKKCKEIIEKFEFFGQKAVLSGSGTTVFAYVKDEKEAISLRNKFKNEFYTEVATPVYFE